MKKCFAIILTYGSLLVPMSTAETIFQRSCISSGAYFSEVIGYDSESNEEWYHHEVTGGVTEFSAIIRTCPDPNIPGTFSAAILCEQSGPFHLELVVGNARELSSPSLYSDNANEFEDNGMTVNVDWQDGIIEIRWKSLDHRLLKQGWNTIIATCQQL
ncbi:MAG: hypothetical protein AAF583_01490 [Pseudomonadota bacterium]